MAISVADLRKIVDVPVNCADDTLQIFVDSANLIATEDLSAAGFSASRLDKICLFLSAHFFIVSKERGGLTNFKVGNSDDGYRQVSSSYVGFQSTVFGQQALALDSSGILANLGTKGTKAQFRVMHPVDRRWDNDGENCA